MMRIRRILHRGWLLGFLFHGCPALAERPETVDVSRWVSNDAVIYVEVTRPADLVDRLSDDRIQKPLRAIPKVKEALEGDAYQKFETVAKLVSDKLGMPWEKALRLLSAGGLVAAVEVVEGEKPHVFLIATPNDTEILAKTSSVLIELARQHAKDDGQPDPIKSREYRGVTGYQVGPDLVYGVVKGRLVVADRGATGKIVVDRILDGLGSAKPLADADDWKAQKAASKPDALAWGLARMDRLRKIDPNRFMPKDKRDTGEVLVFGNWFETVRKAPWIGASVVWTATKLAADVSIPVRAGGRPQAEKGFIPPKDAGASLLASPPGTILNAALWRDYSTVWESRAELLPPEGVQGLAQLDTFAGQYFGGRDFGTGVLGALTSDWRLIIALQDDKDLNPVPDVKLPAFALVLEVKPDDADFAQRLRVAFQSFVGLANIGGAQMKAPPLELGSETVQGVTISTSKYMLPPISAPANSGKKAADKKEPVHLRHNFSPSVALVDNHFIIGSSVGITRDMVASFKSPAKPQSATLVAEADGAAFSRLIDMNRNRLVMQNMLEKGHDKDQAEAEVGLLSALAKMLGQGRLSVKDGADATTVKLDFTLGK